MNIEFVRLLEICSSMKPQQTSFIYLSALNLSHSMKLLQSSMVTQRNLNGTQSKYKISYMTSMETPRELHRTP